jgi:DNA-binding MarR family transcriptional regulator
VTSTTRWLDDDEQRVWRAFVRLQSRLSAELNRRLQVTADLSLADYEVLVALTDVPGARLRPYEMQKTLDWEQSRLSHHLGRMQRRGLVRREECDEDGRGAYIALTETGRRAITQAAPDHVETVRELFFDALKPSQVTALGKIATQVLKCIDAPNLSKDGKAHSQVAPR